MKRQVSLKRLIAKVEQGTALHVILHGLRQDSRGRGVSMTYGEHRTPRESLAQAMYDFEDLGLTLVEKLLAQADISMDWFRHHVNRLHIGIRKRKKSVSTPVVSGHDQSVSLWEEMAELDGGFFERPAMPTFGDFLRTSSHELPCTNAESDEDELYGHDKWDF